MYPTIQLIQLSLRVEREAERQRRPVMVYSDQRVKEEVNCLPEPVTRSKGGFDLLPRQCQCECA